MEPASPPLTLLDVVAHMRWIKAAPRGMIAGAAVSKKDVLYALQNKDDAEAASTVSSYLTSLYKGAAVEPSTAVEGLELTSKIEKKYMAAQAVESGVQVRWHNASCMCRLLRAAACTCEARALWHGVHTTCMHASRLGIHGGTFAGLHEERET